MNKNSILTSMVVLGILACDQQGSKPNKNNPVHQPRVDIVDEIVDEQFQNENSNAANPPLQPPKTEISTSITIASPGELFDFTQAQALVNINGEDIEKVDLGPGNYGMLTSVANFKKIDLNGYVTDILQDAARAIRMNIHDIRVSSRGRILVAVGNDVYLVTESGLEIPLGVYGLSQVRFTSDGDLILVKKISETDNRDSLFIVRKNKSIIERLTPSAWDHAYINDYSTTGQNVYLSTTTQSSTKQSNVFFTDFGAFMFDHSNSIVCGIGNRFVMDYQGSILEPTSSGIKNHRSKLQGVSYLYVQNASYHPEGCFFQGIIDSEDEYGSYQRTEGLYFIDMDLKISKLADLTNDDVSQIYTHDDFALVFNGKTNTLTTYARNGWNRVILQDRNIESFNIINGYFYYSGTGYDIRNSYTGKVNIITGQKSEITFGLGNDIRHIIGLL